MKNILRFCNIAIVLLLWWAAPALAAESALAAEPAPVGNLFEQSPGQWEFVEELSDEFEGDQVNRKLWNTNTEDWGTWSWEPENTFLKDGSLHLQMAQEFHTRDGKELAYTSGIARQHQTVTYGYFEARVKACSRFPGASPAFWLHSKGPENRYQAQDGETVTYSEIDIIELLQSEYNNETKQNNGPDIIDCNLHNVLMRNGSGQWMRPGTHPETNKNEYHAPFDPRNDFHVYAVENNKDFVVWYIDGKEIARKPNIYWHLPMHVTLSLGLRRPFESYQRGQRVAVLEATTQDGFPTDMIVDYVRVWENKDVAAPAAAPHKPAMDTEQDSTGAPKSEASASGMTKTQFVAMEKAKWETNRWAWDPAKVEANFDEMDANRDGVASGIERQDWFAKKKASLKE